MKDSQRQKVYDAERAAFALQTVADATDGWTIGSLEQAQAYIDEVCERNGFAKVRVTTNNGDRWAWANRGLRTISLPSGTHGRWAWTRWVLIHELSHIVATGYPFAAHGLEYCAVYLVLVEKELGEEAAQRLSQSFDKHGVKYRYDAKHQKKVKADFNWRIKRPAEYHTIRVVLKDGTVMTRHSWSNVNGAPGFLPEEIAELSGLVADELVASVS